MTKLTNIHDWVSLFLGQGTDEELCGGSIQCNEWSNQNSYHLFTTVRHDCAQRSHTTPSSSLAHDAARGKKRSSDI
jgi:hypothetical protein